MSLPTTCRIRITGQKFLLNRQLHGLWHTNIVHKFPFVKDVWRWFLVWKEKFWYLINLTQSSDSTRWVTFNLILRHIPSIRYLKKKTLQYILLVGICLILAHTHSVPAIYITINYLKRVNLKHCAKHLGIH